MFSINNDETKLPKETQSAIEKLKAQAAELVAKALTREPKLTDDEKKEISGLEARIKYLAPRKQKLLELLDTKDARLIHLERGGALSMVIDNLDDLDALISEFVSLRPAILLLQDAFNSTGSEISQSDDKIRTIKEKAREREIRAERAK